MSTNTTKGSTNSEDAEELDPCLAAEREMFRQHVDPDMVSRTTA